MSIVLIGLLLPAIGAALPSKIEGSNVLTQEPTKISAEGKHGLVIVFLSAVLREALSDLKAGRKVGMPEGRTLGCIISRGRSHVW